MQAEWRYRGRLVTAQDVAFIQQLIAAHPGASRRRLSQKLCEAWGWRQANGGLRDMVCRGLLLLLHRGGQIELPAVSYVRHNPLAQRQRPQPVLVDTTLLAGRLREIQPLEFQQVRRTTEERLFNGLLEQYHYLGYEQPVGEHLKYLVWAGPAHRLCGLVLGAAALGEPRPLPRLERRGAPAQPSPDCLQHPILDSALGASAESGLPLVEPHGAAGVARLGAGVWTPHLFSGNVRGSGAVCGDLLPGGKLGAVGTDYGAWQGRP